jgi:hypothetical protein
VKRFWFLGLVVVVVLALMAVAGDALAPSGPAAHEPPLGPRVPGWYAWFGLVGCVAIVFVSKALGKWWLMRREDYYQEAEGPGTRVEGRE